jgi:hypothetical protein
VKYREKEKKMANVRLDTVLIFLLPATCGEKVPEGRMRGA